MNETTVTAPAPVVAPSPEQVPAAQPPIVAAQPPVVAGEKIPNVKVSHNKVDITLSPFTTQGKGKSKPVTYYGINRRQFSDSLIAPVGDKATPEATSEYVAQRAAMEYDAYCLLLGHDLVTEMLESKVNTNLKAAQLKQGEDTHTIGEKSAKVIEYIGNDFGAKSKPGAQGAAIKALQDINTRQASLMAQMMSLTTKFFLAMTNNPIEAVAIKAQIDALTQEVQRLQTEIATGQPVPTTPVPAVTK